MASTAPQFFTDEWAQAVKEAVNAGPSDEVKAEKLDKFWDWIENAKEQVNCNLTLVVRGLPEGNPMDGSSNALLLTLDHGLCTEARVVPEAEGAGAADYLLAGSYDDWREYMDGLHVGKVIMYRKLLLEKGPVLEFFKSAYYWTESMACIQRVPTSF